MKTEPRRRIACALLLVCLSHTAPIAHADKVVPDCSADPACLTLYNRAKDASAAGDLDEALRQYKLAHEVRPDPLLLFSIARILHKQGKTKEAVPYYTRFLAAPTEDPVPRKKAEEYLAQIRGQSRPAPEPPATTVASSDAATESKPVYKKWWFWTLIGVGVAGGVAAGVAVAVASAPASSGLPEDVPSVTWTF